MRIRHSGGCVKRSFLVVIIVLITIGGLFAHDGRTMADRQKPLTAEVWTVFLWKHLPHPDRCALWQNSSLPHRF